MKVLITGVGGFVGQYLANEIRGNSSGDLSISGLGKEENFDKNYGLLNDYIEADLTDYDSLKKHLLRINPDEIYHLAAQSSVASSFERPIETFMVNQMGTLNLLEIIVRDLESHPKILLVGSADIYDSPEGSNAIDEDHALNPLNPYAASKVCVDFLGSIYWKNYKVKTLRARSFNHFGPGQSPAFVTANFAKQIAEIEKGKVSPEIHVGNLQAKRDFTDVRDVVSAYRLIMEKGEPGEVYNVCSNNAYSIDKILKLLLERSKTKIKVVVDPERMRPSDNPVLFGSNEKIKSSIGWLPQVTVEKTIDDLLAYWRDQVNANG